MAVLFQVQLTKRNRNLLGLRDTEAPDHAGKPYPLAHLVEENRAWNLLCCYSSYLAWLPTLTLFVTSYYPYLHLHPLCESSDLFYLSHTPFPPCPRPISLSSSPSLIPPCKHLHVSVTFSLKISIFCSSQITSPQDKSTVIKPLLTESGSSRIRFSFPGSRQLSDPSWHWLGVGQIWWLLRVPPSYPVDVKSGRLDSLSATWPTHPLCDLFGLWALGFIFTSPRSLTLH